MSSRRALIPIGLLLLLVASRPRGEREGPAVTPTRAQPEPALDWADLPILTETRLPAYLPGQVMVAAADLDRVARRVGAQVLHPVGPSGYGALATPAGIDDGTFRARLLALPDVTDAAPIGRIVGAGKKSSTAATTSTSTRASPYQWHLDFADAPYASTTAAGVVVAVIDSGVAYATGSEGKQAFVQVPSLAGVPILSPWDFVEDDATPYDEHQHGTHIASIIASSGRVEGVSVGASLMPLRVLDSENSGTELDLIDALTWARTHGAQVVNMSLSFGEGYAPSTALARAINQAAEAGIVLVAAAGNDGLDRVSYPAAHPRVVAVGAVAPESLGSGEVAWYSDYGPRVDVMGPGGDPYVDRTGDGYVDGILAETIDLRDPKHTGLWFYVGTSQAAAAVSGAAAHLVKAGASAADTTVALQLGAKAESWTGASFEDGFGAGRERVNGALSSYASGLAYTRRTFHASVVTWLVDAGGGMVEPHARITVTDDQGKRLKESKALVSFFGPSDSFASCDIDKKTGECDVVGEAVDGEEASAWVVSLDGLKVGDVAYRPYGIFHQSEGLERLVAAMATEGELADAVLGFRWTAGKDDSLGDVVDSVMIADMAADTYSSPRAVLLSRGLVDEAEVIDEGAIDVDGGGLITTPMFRSGVSSDRSYSLISLGTGLITTPMVRVAILPATSLESTSLGLSAFTLFEGSGLITTPMAMPVLLGRSTGDPLAASAAVGTSLDGTAVGSMLEFGGWLVEDTTTSSVLLASGLGGIGVEGSSADGAAGTRLSN